MSSALSGKKLSILGSISLTRSEVREQCATVGIKVGLFSLDDDFVIVGEGSNQTQVDAARNKGRAKILDEKEFKKLIANPQQAFAAPAPAASPPETFNKIDKVRRGLFGKEIGIVGKIKMTRLEVRQMASRVGMKVTVDVTKDFVIAGEGSDEKILAACKNQGTIIMSETAFVKSVEMEEKMQTQGKKHRKNDDDDDGHDDDDAENEKKKPVKATKKEGQSSPHQQATTTPAANNNNNKNQFQGKTICFTGQLSQLTRAEAKTKAQAAGGKVTTTVSGNTNIVVVGGKAGDKLDVAKKHGCKILSEDQFLQAIAGKNVLADNNNNNNAPADDYPKVQWAALPAPEPDFTDATLVEVESKLGGYKLPLAYVNLCKKSRNGGNVEGKSKFVIKKDDYEVGIEQIYGISLPEDSKGGSIVEWQENWIEEWEYPKKNKIYFCDTESGGHDMICFDYSKCGKRGEPRILNLDQELEFREIVLAENFTDFINGLVEPTD